MHRAVNKTKPHFVNWFPQMAEDFSYILLHDCWSDYQLYVEDKYQNYQNVLGKRGCSGCAIAPVARCLNDKAWALANENMQAAGVLLGVLPTILTFAGPSKVETGILALRRPCLSALISLGSPAVNPLRTVDYNAPAMVLQLWEGNKRHSVPEKNTVLEVIAILFQYLVVLAAVANIYEVTYELCYWAICSFAPETTYMPLLYPIATLVLHIIGVEAVRRRVQLSSIRQDGDDTAPNHDIHSWLRRGVSREFHLTGSEHHRPSGPTRKILRLTLKEETYAFLLANFLLSTFSTMHLVFGTLVFSSILFISVNDAAIVAIRFLFSTIAVRLVLTYELSGLREVTIVEQPIRVPSSIAGRSKNGELRKPESEPLV